MRKTRQLSTRTVYRNPHIRVREDQVEHGTGSRGLYGVVEFNPGVGVLAVDEAHQVLLLRLFRYPVQSWGWEIVNGTAEPGESPDAAARRELREEGGVAAADLMPLGWYHSSAGITNEACHLFLARELREVEDDPDATEQFERHWFPFADALDMIRNGEIRGASTIIALLESRLLFNVA